MMVPRKRQRRNPAAASPPSLPTTALSREVATSHGASASTDGGPEQPQAPRPLRSYCSSAALAATCNARQIRKARSWYGSWPRAPSKASASTSVARENILGGTVRSTRAPDLSRFEPKHGDESASLLSKVPEDGRAMSDGGGKDARQDGRPEHEATTQDAATPLRHTPSSSWLGWWSRTPFTETSPAAMQPNEPPTPPSQPAAAGDVPANAAPTATSWFGFWSSGDGDAETEPKPGGAEPAMEDTKARAPPVPQKREPAPKAGSTWAFWSRDPPATGGQASGEIAVMGEGSETRPKPMTESDVSGAGAAKEPRVKETRSLGRSAWRRKKRARPASADAEPQTAPAADATAEGAPAEGAPAEGAPAASGDSSTSEAAAAPNLVLPCFHSTYRTEDNPSMLQQMASLLLRTPAPAPARHVFRAPDPPRIRRAVAIGVHGLFPAPYLRPMIGHPTGTSLRFAGLCADAIRRWAAAHGCGDCEVEKVALEGEGRIGERVDNLWKLLLNWIDDIRRADVVVVAAHSQGVPVAVVLLAKLLDLGLLSPATTRVGVCAMAGVALGPFADYRSSLLMGSAAELWEFADPRSANARRFEDALRRVVDFGARVTFVGSIDDQVVPLESAVYAPASHPYIYRAVFVDGRLHAPDFMAHLVGFALKLRNLGVSDHGLVRELSAPLAGSLYSGDGHSRLYFDPAVYDLALVHTLETAPTPGPVPLAIAHPEPPVAAEAASPAAPNPYVLPWVMRGLLEERFVKTELSAETDDLLRLFDEWRPATKALRDVKYRLEAVRSRL